MALAAPSKVDFVDLRRDSAMFESELSPLLSLLLRLDGSRCSVGWSASRVYGTLRSTGLLAGYIIPCYDVLHTFSKEYMVEHPDVQHSRPNLDFGGASLPW